ncbi:MAG: Uma2 family endonuclease [Saprospirales bacterium]|nr:Uma2 family endonuclease [Saprospirales bacterium]
MVIEVADTSLPYDRKIKALLYAEFGIPEYWILNLRDQCVEQYQLPGAKGYLRKTIVQKDQWLALPGPDAEIHVSALLGISAEPPK